jgi:hypothetical protein
VVSDANKPPSLDLASNIAGSGPPDALASHDLNVTLLAWPPRPRRPFARAWPHDRDSLPGRARADHEQVEVGAHGLEA